jgi:hypothetical protein
MAFGRELRDFIAAFQAGHKIAGSNDDREYKRLRTQVLRAKNSPERLKLEEDTLRARAERLRRGPQARPMHPAQIRALDARTDYYRKRQDLMVNPPKAPSALDGIGGLGPAPSQGAVPGPQSALPIDSAGNEFQTSELDPALEDEIDEPVQLAARGGLIRKIKGYADGGAVEADEPDDYEEPDDSADFEADELDYEDDVAEGTAPAAAAPSAPQGKGYSPQAAHDAALAGTKYAMAADKSQSEGAIDVSAQSRQRAPSYRTGNGAASAAEMGEIYKAIDPQGKLSESERTMAGLAHVWEWNLKNNNPQAAERAAASMVQYGRVVAGRYQALAKVAAENGDVDGATRAILKAHAAVPDGLDMKIVKRKDGSIAWSIVDDQTGKTVENGIASPEQILAFASKGAAQSFDGLIANAAGQRASSRGGARQAGARKADQRGAYDEQISEVMAKNVKEGTADKGLEASTRHFVGQVLADNDMEAGDALTVAHELTTVGEAPTFKVARTPEGATVTLRSGREIALSKDAYQNLVALRGKAAQAYAKRQKADADKLAREGERSALRRTQDENMKAELRKTGMEPLPQGIP